MPVPPPSQGRRERSVGCDDENLVLQRSLACELVGWVSYYYGMEHFSLVGRSCDADCGNIVHLGNDKERA